MKFLNEMLEKPQQAPGNPVGEPPKQPALPEGGGHRAVDETVRSGGFLCSLSLPNCVQTCGFPLGKSLNIFHFKREPKGGKISVIEKDTNQAERFVGMKDGAHWPCPLCPRDITVTHCPPPSFSSPQATLPFSHCHPFPEGLLSRLME